MSFTTNYNVRSANGRIYGKPFGTITVRYTQKPTDIKLWGGHSAPPRNVTTGDIEASYGTNCYDVLNQSEELLRAASNSANLFTASQAQSANVADTSKSSAQTLASVSGASTYGELSAAKAEMEIGQDNIKASFNDEVSTYIDEDTQAVLQELGISIPTMDKISGEYDDFEKDMKVFEDGLNKCQDVQDSVNEKLPEVLNNKSLAQSRVDGLEAQKTNLEQQIIAAKLAGKDTSELEAQLEQVKKELDAAKEELEKYKKQEKACNTALSQADDKKAEIEQNKIDFANYHEAESKIVDKTYEIAQEDDRKLQETNQKLKQKLQKIKEALQDTNSTKTNGADDTRNEQLERLQGEYEEIAASVTDIFVDLEHLMSDNNGSKNVKNSSGRIYTIKHYDETKKTLEEGLG